MKQNEGKCMVRERGAKACLCNTTRKTSKTREVRFGNEWMPVLGGKMATSRGLETGQRREKRNRTTQVSHHMLSVSGIVRVPLLTRAAPRLLNP